MATVIEISVRWFEQLEPSTLLLPLALAILAILYYVMTSSSRSKVYLVDFVCFKGPKTHRVPISTFIEHAEIIGNFDSDTVEFQTKVIERSGIGNQSYLPEGIHFLPPSTVLAQGVRELELVMSSAVGNLLKKLDGDISPESIDVLITNCSLVTPTPSLSSMVINKFGLRSDVKSYNLSGMGCSAGLLALSLGKQMLRVHKNCTVLIMSTEAISPCVYEGKLKSMLLSNCLFRMGGAAVLLSNIKRKKGAKYELQHVVTTNIASKDAAYKCVYHETDSEGYSGMNLSRSLMEVAGEGLRTNLTTLAKLALPYTELIKYGVRLAWRGSKERGRLIPDFKKAFDHFCIHAGGKAVVDGMQKKLNLTDGDIEASKMTLHRFGNTSSSSIWYSLSYLEAKGRVRRGDKVWQLGLGSGFKCHSAVWKCTSNPKSDRWNVWSDSIDQYPMEVPDLTDH